MKYSMIGARAAGSTAFQSVGTFVAAQLLVTGGIGAKERDCQHPKHPLVVV